MDEPTVLPFEEVAGRLNQAKITWAMFAGAAATAYGADRPLTDIDILVRASEGERAASLFPKAHVKEHPDGTIAMLQLAGYDILAGLKWMEENGEYAVDLDDPMSLRLTHHEIGGVIVPVIPPEDNILLKALRGRGPEEGKHDWEDVQAMMAHTPSLDWEYLRWRAAQCGPPGRIEQVLEQLAALSDRYPAQP